MIREIILKIILIIILIKKNEEYKQPLFIISNFSDNHNKSCKILKSKNNINTIYNFNKSYRLPSGAEKKKNFYYL